METNQISEIVDVIVDAVNLHHIDKGTVSKETPLTGEGLGLDSVDILEVVVAIEQHYGIKVPSAEEGKKHFQTIGSIAEFVSSTASSPKS